MVVVESLFLQAIFSKPFMVPLSLRRRLTIISCTYAVQSDVFQKNRARTTGLSYHPALSFSHAHLFLEYMNPQQMYINGLHSTS